MGNGVCGSFRIPSGIHGSLFICLFGLSSSASLLKVDSYYFFEFRLHPFVVFTGCCRILCLALGREGTGCFVCAPDERFHRVNR